MPPFICRADHFTVGWAQAFDAFSEDDFEFSGAGEGAGLRLLLDEAFFDERKASERAVG
jgi:hypothetical protein